MQPFPSIINRYIADGSDSAGAVEGAGGGEQRSARLPRGAATTLATLAALAAAPAEAAPCWVGILGPDVLFTIPIPDADEAGAAGSGIAAGGGASPTDLGGRGGGGASVGLLGVLAAAAESSSPAALPHVRRFHLSGISRALALASGAPGVARVELAFADAPAAPHPRAADAPAAPHPRAAAAPAAPHPRAADAPAAPHPRAADAPAAPHPRAGGGGGWE
jgi:hypothetical protein